jgi:hypothetical protein
LQLREIFQQTARNSFIDWIRFLHAGHPATTKRMLKLKAQVISGEAGIQIAATSSRAQS